MNNPEHAPPNPAGITTPVPPREAATPLRLGGRQRRERLEGIAMLIMLVGLLMIFQPLAKALYTYSFLVILAGTIMFIVVSHLPDH
ncbi:hypothetical protein [Kallotenue papyrolyticum]|uniref:hypothetical protein n=1 Tax=Kallotenue papyrolyticum TaxID=1325125 RepID=UPI0004ADD239|nr:hypothetical protein [Kallotenue papyrolyticum]